MSEPKPDKEAARRALEKMRRDPATQAELTRNVQRQIGAYAHAQGLEVEFANDVSEEERQAVDEGYLAAAMFESVAKGKEDGTTEEPPVIPASVVRRLLKRAARRSVKRAVRRIWARVFR